jgi:protein TonB
VTAASFLRDLTAFSVQIALVGLGIAMLLKLVKLPAGVRYTGLRLALVASLLAPWLLRTPEVQAPALATPVVAAVSQAPLATAGAPAISSAGAAASVATDSTPTIPWVQVGFGALLLGISARIAWLAMGVLRLLRLKREGVVVDAPEYSELQHQLGTHATIAQVALPQPATFGVRRPIVLLPDTLAEASFSLRRAVVAHELFHVRRRDWLSVLAEEAVRTALWFHPAVLWMTSQIQLAREEIVDELTVQATGDRRAYVETLLAFADTPGLSPAPAFAQRRQLFHRILSVSKEKAMSRPRLVSSAAVLLATVAGASWCASTLFPIVKAAKADVQVSAPEAGPQASTQSGAFVVVPDSLDSLDLRAGELILRNGNALALRGQRNGEVIALVTPENPIPRRTRGTVPVRPAQFAGVQAVINALVMVDRNGVVTSVARDECSVASRTGGDAVCAAFYDATAAAIRQWRYDRPIQAPIQFYVTVTFRPDAEPRVTQSGERNSAGLRETQDGLRRLAETVRDNADLQQAVASLQADLARMSDMSREFERAQRLGERGLLAQSTLQEGMARLRASLARVEAQLQNIRLTGDDRARVERQYRTVLEQYREAERQFRSASAQQLTDLREAERQLDQTARQFETNRDSPADLETLARAAREAADAVRRAEAGDAAARAQSQAATERLREAQRKLEAARAQRSASVDGSQQLRSPSGRTPIRVSDVPGMKPPTVRRNVKPEHPLAAMKARVEGTVVLEALVDEQGRVADVRVMKSIPLLDEAALDAARQWQFTPTLMNGEPVPVLVQLEMNFTLK